MIQQLFLLIIALFVMNGCVVQDNSIQPPQCTTDSDCAWITDYCGCQNICAHKYTEFENCPKSLDCEIPVVNDADCRCINNECQ